MRLILRGLKTLASWILALLILFEEWGWEPLNRLLARLARLPLIGHIERRADRACEGVCRVAGPLSRQVHGTGGAGAPAVTAALNPYGGRKTGPDKLRFASRPPPQRASPRRLPETHATHYRLPRPVPPPHP